MHGGLEDSFPDYSWLLSFLQVQKPRMAGEGEFSSFLWWNVVVQLQVHLWHLSSSISSYLFSRQEITCLGFRVISWSYSQRPQLSPCTKAPNLVPWLPAGPCVVSPAGCTNATVPVTFLFSACQFMVLPEHLTYQFYFPALLDSKFHTQCSPQQVT